MRNKTIIFMMVGFFWVLGCTKETDSDGTDDNDTDFSSDTTNNSDSDNNNYCEIVTVNAAPNPPRVMILQDLSSSLNTYGRWDPLKAAMIEVVDTYDSEFLLGLVPFATTVLDGGWDDGDCTVSREHVIAPAQGNAAAIKEKVYNIDTTELVGGTPTYEALIAAKEVLVDNDPGDGSDRVVILVTDGAPNCLDGDGGGESTPADQERVTDEIQQLFNDNGMTIYVVGYDMSGDAADLMDTWASLGGTTAHFPADNTAELVTQMEVIRSTLVPCEYTLESAIEDATKVRVQIDGVSKPYNEENGWLLDDSRTSITLVDDSCANLRDGETHQVDITVECETVEIEPE